MRVQVRDCEGKNPSPEENRARKTFREDTPHVVPVSYGSIPSSHALFKITNPAPTSAPPVGGLQDSSKLFGASPSTSSGRKGSYQLLALLLLARSFVFQKFYLAINQVDLPDFFFLIDSA